MVESPRVVNYPDRELEACRRILMEVVNLLKDFSDHIALVGGWVPFYIVPQTGNPHIGSLDVDIAFDFQNITDNTYETILNMLIKNNYYQINQHKPFQWWKDIKVDDGDHIKVELDLLAPEYGGRGTRHENQHIQDTKARKARGSDLLFDGFNRYKEITLEGTLPNGASDSVRCKVAGVVPFLVMKGMAIGRGKTKDAYDIEYVIYNYAGGLNALIAEFERDLSNSLVQEGLGKIRTKFETTNHAGPDDVATFLEIEEPESRAIRKQQAYQTVSAFLDALTVKKFL